MGTNNGRGLWKFDVAAILSVSSSAPAMTTSLTSIYTDDNSNYLQAVKGGELSVNKPGCFLRRRAVCWQADDSVCFPRGPGPDCRERCPSLFSPVPVSQSVSQPALLVAMPAQLKAGYYTDTITLAASKDLSRIQYEGLSI